MNLTDLPAILTAAALVITAVASVVAAWRGVANGQKLNDVKAQAAATHALVSQQPAPTVGTTTGPPSPPVPYLTARPHGDFPFAPPPTT